MSGVAKRRKTWDEFSRTSSEPLDQPPWACPDTCAVRSPHREAAGSPVACNLTSPNTAVHTWHVRFNTCLLIPLRTSQSTPSITSYTELTLSATSTCHFSVPRGRLLTLLLCLSSEETQASEWQPRAGELAQHLTAVTALIPAWLTGDRQEEASKAPQAKTFQKEVSSQRTAKKT